ncbi:hypothetical protein INT46_009632 [Mucor plumbeus]|uniref:Transposase Tc1-like domain-containing protein n=1 Tax=Mucor plumbeus TaxID=97098 RepID=A0A8H7V351_9FUNG|nr:hypothetical protein INT46_009632 [Mucor plumbeus]
MQHIGSTKELIERNERRLVAITRKNLFATYDCINLQLRIHQIDISRFTVTKYLTLVGVGSNFEAYKPALPEENRKRRLRWAKEQANWAMEQWGNVIWSD